MEIGEIAYGLDNEGDNDEKLSVRLLEYAASGDILEIKRFFRTHHSFEYVDYDERGPLHVSAASGHLEVC